MTNNIVRKLVPSQHWFQDQVELLDVYCRQRGIGSVMWVHQFGWTFRSFWSVEQRVRPPWLAVYRYFPDD